MATLIEPRSEFKAGEVVVFKTAVGAELIGKVTAVANDEITFTHLYQFDVARHPETGQPQLHLVPYYMSCPPDGKFVIYRDAIISKTHATSKVTLDAYTSHTSDIQTVNLMG